ncbi:MAG: exosortase/archaeosortase family protein [Nitrospirae bacterium]|nr:MAG: exosortase/archaeosortase family protein [Nitrospirota bacterium]
MTSQVSSRPWLAFGYPVGYGVGGLTILGLLAVLYSEVLMALVRDWYDNPDYSHGFLVPLMSGYFVWERRHKLRNLPIRPNWWGGLLLACALGLFLLGTIGAELYTQRISLILVIAGLVLLLCGAQWLRQLMLPIGFLVFMVPLPAIVVNTIAFPLQIFAAQTAAFCLFNLGIPVLREGNLITLAGSTLEVAEACSGLRSLLALLTLGTVYGYFSQRVLWKRWLLLLLSIPIAIVANALRVTGTGILANTWGTEVAEGFYHTFEGWIVFVVAFVLLLGCGTILSRIGREVSMAERAPSCDGFR